MPTITIPHAFSSGDVTSPAKIAENLHSPNTTPDSFDVINGWLEQVNLNGWEVGTDLLQQGEMTRSGMTAGKPSMNWPRDAATTVSGAGVALTPATMQAIPGATRSLRVPFAMALAVVSWGVYYSSNDGADSAKLYMIQQAPGSHPVTVISHQRRTLNTSNIVATASSIRWWAGSRIIQIPAQGDWTFGIRLSRNAQTAEANSKIHTDWRYCNVVLIK